MNDRIKLAEAIWPDRKIYHQEPYRNDGGDVGYHNANGTFRAFNPYVDANDDYTVFMWMCSQERFTPEFWIEFNKTNLMSTYKIGNYARAALKELNGE